MTTTPTSSFDIIDRGGEARRRVTADRVRRWEFTAASFARRGYDPADVDRFRVQVADELDVLASLVANLREENQRLQDRVELHRHGVIPSSTPGQPTLPGAREVNLLSAAQREAEQIIAQAHDYARRVADYARMQYESYVQAAVQDARLEAERVVQEYRARSGSGFDQGVAAREALRIFGEMMISHLQAAARQLDDSSEHLARTLDRLAVEAGQQPPDQAHQALPPRSS